MNECPVHKLKPLPPMPARIAKLPVGEQGYPIPYFVAYIDGKPDFRVGDPNKLLRCVQRKLCWVCGEPLGVYMAFVVGPMCVVSGTAADPPTHYECAEWSVKACPFLTRPNMVRRQDERTEAMKSNVAGFMIERNPGAMAIYNTRAYRLFKDGRKGILFKMGPCESISWWREGRAATRDEVMLSMNEGIPILRSMCDGDSDLKALAEKCRATMKLLPV